MATSRSTSQTCLRTIRAVLPRWTRTQFFFGDTEADWLIRTVPGRSWHHRQRGRHLHDHAARTDFSTSCRSATRAPGPSRNVDVTHVGANLFTENFDIRTASEATTTAAGGFGGGDLDARQLVGPARRTASSVPTATAASRPPAAMALSVLAGHAELAGRDQHLARLRRCDRWPGQLSFDIAVQNLDYLGSHYETDHDASIEFRSTATWSRP